jgi:hypothetical protein
MGGERFVTQMSDFINFEEISLPFYGYFQNEIVIMGVLNSEPTTKSITQFPPNKWSIFQGLNK